MAGGYTDFNGQKFWLGTQPNISFTTHYSISNNQTDKFDVTFYVDVSGIGGSSYFGYNLHCSCGDLILDYELKGNTPSQWEAFRKTVGTWTLPKNDQGWKPISMGFWSNSGNSIDTGTYSFEWPQSNPEIYTKVNGIWKNGVPYVKVNGVWKIAKNAYVKSGGTWHGVL